MRASDKYGKYETTLLYNSTARASLRIDLYDMKNTLEDECMFMKFSMYRFKGLPLYDYYRDDEYEMKFFLKAAFLCYIPYDTAGYEYIKREWLGGESLVDYRYKNVMKKLKYMGIILDESDSEKLRYLFASQEGTVFKLDPVGIAALALRVRTALEGEFLSKYNGMVSLRFSKAFSAKIGEIASVAVEQRLEEIDISEYLPKYEPRGLYGKDEDYLDFLFEAQSFPEVYEYKVGIDEYVKVSNKQTTSYMLGSMDKHARVGDKITITYDNVQISAEITRLRNYPDYISLPNEKYGFNIGTYNPYFYDNYTVKENGGVTLADFEIDERHKVHNVFTVNYWEHQLAGFEDAKEIYLIRKESDVYMHVSYSSEFILKDCMGRRTIKAVSPGLPDLACSKESLFSKLEDGVPCIPTRKEIENGCFKEEELKDGVKIIKLEIKE